MKKILIKDLIERFNRDNDLRQLRPDSLAYYKQFLGYFVAWLPANIKWSNQLTKELFEEYQLYIYGKVEKSTTQATYFRAVRRLYNFSAENGYSSLVKIKLPKTKRPIKPTFSDSDVAKLIEGFGDSKADLICLLLISTGIRSRTLRCLKVCDYSPSEKQLRLTDLKNGEEALLPIPQLVCDKLTSYIKKKKLGQHDFLLLDHKGKQYTRNGLYQFIRKSLARRGIPSSGIHIFRRTYAKLMAREGCPSITLSRCLTHKTISQSEYYVNLYGKDLERAVERYNPVVTFKDKK